MRWLDSITGSVHMSLSRRQETVQDRAAWHAAVHGVAESDSTMRDASKEKEKRHKPECPALGSLRIYSEVLGLFRQHA